MRALIFAVFALSVACFALGFSICLTLVDRHAHERMVKIEGLEAAIDHCERHQ